MLIDFDAFHRVQLLLLLVLENLPLPCDFGEYNALLEIFLEDLVRIPVALGSLDRLELVLRLDMLDLIIFSSLVSFLLSSHQQG